jgi:hypothetical protein
MLEIYSETPSVRILPLWRGFGASVFNFETVLFCAAEEVLFQISVTGTQPAALPRRLTL